MSDRTAIVFEPLHPDVAPPARATAGSAGYDLQAYLLGTPTRVNTGHMIEDRPADESCVPPSVELLPGEVAMIPLGFRARLPAGWEAQIRPRSGTAFRKSLLVPNAPGTIDADYPDEWRVLIRNAGAHPVRIEHGERIAQAVLHRFEVLEWEPGRVERTTDRAGGFGSTGS